MDGDITVASVPGQGSCFTFTARFEPGESAASAPRREMPEPALPVLVADDNPAARDVFLHMLSRLGFPARAVASGEEAIAELDAAEQAGRPYGLLVADWQMPGLDGVETVRRLRADRAIAATPAIVMTTAYDRDELAEALAGLGVGAILPKPVTPSALHDSIATALHGEGARPGPGAPLAAAADLADRLNLTPQTLDQWRDIAEHMTVLYNPDTGLFDQFEGFFARERVDPEVFRTAERSLQVIFGIEGANARQVLKQADVIMLLCLFRDEFDHHVWQTNWDAYMPITDHRFGSSLGPSFHAWAACEMERIDEAYAHFMLAARADLRNPRGNAGDGIHAASTGGVWQAAAFGFAGLRPGPDGWTLQPRLPRHWRRLAFTYRYRGQPYQVDIHQDEGGDFSVTHQTRD